MTPSSTVKRKVDALIKERRLKQYEVEKGIDMSHGGYNGMWKRGSVDLETLQALARFFQVPMGYFLPASEQLASGTSVNEPAATYKPKRYLEQRVDDLEELVGELVKRAAT